jgi:hypothetical protein
MWRSFPISHWKKIDRQPSQGTQKNTSSRESPVTTPRHEAGLFLKCDPAHLPLRGASVAATSRLT